MNSKIYNKNSQKKEALNDIKEVISEKESSGYEQTTQVTMEGSE